MAQKFGEEAVECLIEAVAGNHDALIAESADVLYHLIVLWVSAGVAPRPGLGRTGAARRHQRHRRKGLATQAVAGGAEARHGEDSLIAHIGPRLASRSTRRRIAARFQSDAICSTA